MLSTVANFQNSQVPGIRTRVPDRPDAKQPSGQSDIRVAAKSFNFWYGTHRALRDISMDIYARQVTAIIGPSGCGKSTFLRSLNRMNDVIPNIRMEGEIILDGQNIIAPDINVVTLRRNVGMVFQQPNPFPKSIFDNVAYGLRINGLTNSAMERDSRVEEALRHAAIWDEVKEQLHKSALSMSGGEQQRLCIARALAVRPEILLMDEPASALDPISTAKIEDLIFQLKKEYTIVIVTHNMQQAARVSDYTAFFLQGELIEFGPTVQIFTKPGDKRTEDYITGRFG
jgi:phosphate transport system ATP-binding protein